MTRLTFSASFCAPEMNLVGRLFRLLAEPCTWLFLGSSFDEVYNILTGLMIKVINTYDPHYTDKVKLVVEAIDRLADPDAVITGPELNSPLRPEAFSTLDGPQ